MSLQLCIPDSIVKAIKMPEERICDELSIELAAMLYSEELLSFGKARELAGMGKYEFGQLLGKKGIMRHYGKKEMEDDFSYACSE